jgi:hypothetical protein
MDVIFGLVSVMITVTMMLIKVFFRLTLLTINLSMGLLRSVSRR